MKKYCLIMLFLISYTVFAQNLRNAGDLNRYIQLRGYFFNLPSMLYYISSSDFNETRMRLLEMQDVKAFGNDTLIFVESASIPSSNYLCAVFKSNENITKVYTYEDGTLVEYLSKKTFGKYFIDAFRQKRLPSVLSERCQKKNAYPGGEIAITTAIKYKEKYEINTYYTSFVYE